MRCAILAMSLVTTKASVKGRHDKYPDKSSSYVNMKLAELNPCFGST